MPSILDSIESILCTPVAPSWPHVSRAHRLAHTPQNRLALGSCCRQQVKSTYSIQRAHHNSLTPPLTVESVALLCSILLLVIHFPIAKYLIISVAVACSTCVCPVLWPERIRAAHGTTAAGLAVGITNASAQLMGIVGPQVYQSRFGPEYRVV